MTAIIPAHRAVDADITLRSRGLDTAAYVMAELRDPALTPGGASDLARWVRGALYEIGVEVGGIAMPTAAPFTEDEINDPRLLVDLDARAQAARETFDADMRAQGAGETDLAVLRDHYQPAAPILTAFLDRLIATLCALEAQCRDAAQERPASSPADLALLAVIWVAIIRALDTARRGRAPVRIDPATSTAVTLTRAARAPGAHASA